VTKRLATAKGAGSASGLDLVADADVTRCTQQTQSK